MSDTPRRHTNDEALRFHSQGKPGKLEVVATKPLATQRDLSLAYSPGVAVPVRAIAENPDLAYEYTAKGNLVAVITNGSAILGLGNLGALASKPVMEGKAVLFKRFADIDSIDIELDTGSADDIINAVRYMGPSFAGINLEDIKSPECFIIERALREMMDIPVFHDDQHGTAIIVAAGVLNALDLTGRTLERTRLVMSGAGAAGIACIELLKKMGLPDENAILVDIDGVLHADRGDIDEWRAPHAPKTDLRTLADAVNGADLFLGLSAPGILTPEMLMTMAERPVIFAMANPDPEISPEDAREARPDAIIATGRSDYPNQVNNVLGFPYIFRGALDVRARTINDEMKIAAARAIAQLARQDVHDDVSAAYGRKLRYGPDYIIPAPFDPRLIHQVPVAVAQAAMNSGVARKPIIDLAGYEQSLMARLDPTVTMLQRLHERVRMQPRRVVFAEGEDERVIRAAVSYTRAGLGEAILIGRGDEIHETARKVGLDGVEEVTIHNARLSERVPAYTEHLYTRLQRRGRLHRDCERMVQQDRNIFAALMVETGDADAMISGVTGKSSMILEDVRLVLDPDRRPNVIGVTAVLARGRTVLVADTLVHEMPGAEELANIAEAAAGAARKLGLEPRVAMTSYSTFGYPESERSDNLRDAVRILEARGVDFEFDGEMAADVALSRTAMETYPFCRLSGPANVLVMPARHSASISTKMLRELGGSTLIGPILVGMESPVQLCPMGSGVSDIVNMAVFAAGAF